MAFWYKKSSGKKTGSDNDTSLALILYIHIYLYLFIIDISFIIDIIIYLYLFIIVCTVFLYTHTKNFKYIHDIFLLFTGTNNKPDQFLNDLNKTQHSIKFHYSVSQNHIAFLNVEIYLHTKIYRRETDQQQYLHIKSDHSKSMKEQSSRPNQVNKFQWSRFN